MKRCLILSASAIAAVSGFLLSFQYLFPDPVRIAVQLLPCCRNIGDPEIERVSGAAVTIQNMTARIQRDIAIQLMFPNIKAVDLDDPGRIKVIGGSRPGRGGGNYVHLLVPELAQKEMRHVMVEFAFWTDFRSIADWRKSYRYSSNIVLVGPGLMTIGPEQGYSARASCRPVSSTTLTARRLNRRNFGPRPVLVNPDARSSKRIIWFPK